MQPAIKLLSAKKLIGSHLKMSYANDKTAELWRSFMPRRKEITNNRTTDLISMQLYNPGFDVDNRSQDNVFEKWAAVEVFNFDAVPDGMESYRLPWGLYAIFHHRGAADTGPEMVRYIFGTWLPGSDYAVDNRPHFEVLSKNYKNNDPESEEELWIPIKPRHA